MVKFLALTAVFPACATLYFFVPKDGEIARNVAADSAVNVAYANTDKDSYVSVSGRAALLLPP